MQIASRIEGRECEAFYAPFDVRFPHETQEFDVVQPDIVVICNPEKIDGRGCNGAPDFIIEILSPSTAYKDLTIKRRLYEKHGVTEFWFVDPSTRSAMIFFEREAGDYKVFDLESGQTITSQALDIEINFNIW